MSAVGTALGPALGGVLIAGLGWQAIFLVNLPLGILTVFLAHRHLPVDRRGPDSARAGFDHVGTLVLALTLAAYALAMTMGRGRFGLLNATLLLAAMFGAGLFVLVEARAGSPLIRVATLGDPVLRAGLAMSALVSTVLMATLVVGPFYSRVRSDSTRPSWDSRCRSARSSRRSAVCQPVAPWTVTAHEE